MQAYEERNLRCQLLGVPQHVIGPLLDYVDALNNAQLNLALTQYPHLLDDRGVSEEHRAFHFRSDLGMRYNSMCAACAAGEGFPEPTVDTLKEYFDVDPGAQGGGKYVQIVRMSPSYRTGEMAPDSVHSVVIKATGEVCKSAGWKKGPAKSTAKARKGQPLVAYVLTDPDQFSAMLDRLDTYGAYLYRK